MQNGKYYNTTVRKPSNFNVLKFLDFLIFATFIFATQIIIHKSTVIGLIKHWK